MPEVRHKMKGMSHDKLMECESEKKRLSYGTSLYTHILESPLVCVCLEGGEEIFSILQEESCWYLGTFRSAFAAIQT
jgi:hypothetical protein